MASAETPQEGKKAGAESMTLARRARLEKIFEHASRKVAAGADFDYTTELLTQCVLGDPGNIAYVRCYIENLQKKYDNNRKGSPLAQFKERASRSAQKKALAAEDWEESVRHGLKVLTVNPWDVTTLIGLSTAANKMGHRECELFYLRSALAANPRDPTVNRLCAITLDDLGQYDQAIVCWHRVEEARPDDDEPKRSVASLMVKRSRDRGEFGESPGAKAAAMRANPQSQQSGKLTPEQELQQKITREPEHIPHYLQLAEYYIGEERFQKAEEVLARAYKASKEDPEIREKWDDVQLRHLRQAIAKTSDPAKKKKFQRAYFEKELDVCKKRVERYPNNLGFKYELGYRYMLTKQYNDAIRELQSAKNDPRKKGISLLALGQCFQQIKQYRLAMSHYESAIQEISDRDTDNKKKALYTAGRLALALRDVDTAEKHLSVLAGLDFTYKDISELLDKIAKLRENPVSTHHQDNTPPE
jgi:tetratricopeptide (TPR) repeat protein